MRFKRAAVLMMVIAGVPVAVFAGGAAAQRNPGQGPRVRQQVRPVARPVLPARPPPSEEEKKPAAPPPKKKAKIKTAPSKVLVSSAAGQKMYSASVATSDGSAMEQELASLFRLLEQSSQLWPQISDMRVKMLVVAHYVDLYHQFGIEITKPAVYYVNVISVMTQENPALLSQPFDQLLRVVAIIEYDYNSGENKDDLARSLLGAQKFSENKKRLGLK